MAECLCYPPKAITTLLIGYTSEGCMELMLVKSSAQRWPPPRSAEGRCSFGPFYHFAEGDCVLSAEPPEADKLLT